MINEKVKLESNKACSDAFVAMDLSYLTNSLRSFGESRGAEFD